MAAWVAQGEVPPDLTNAIAMSKLPGDEQGNFVIAWKQGTEAFVDSVFS